MREERREKGLDLGLDVWTRRDNKVHADAGVHLLSCALFPSYV